MNNRNRSIALVAALVLLLTAVIGGTIAWLVDNTEALVNTFTSSDVDIELAETTGVSYQMIPGCTITKDPVVTVLADSEACFVFVKVEKANEFDNFMEYTMADGWTALSGVENVFYRVVDDTDVNQEFHVLANDTITVKDSVTKAMMDELTADTYPTLTITAYATQYMKNNTENFTATEAWENVNSTN